MNICPTMAVVPSSGTRNVEIRMAPYVVASWREGTELAEINAELPPWLALTIEQYARREFAFFNVKSTGDVERWFRGFVSLIGPLPPPDAGPSWVYVHPTNRSDKRQERTLTLDQYEQTA